MSRVLLCLLVLTSLCHAETKVLALSGSTRGGSYNTALLLEAAEIAQQHGAKVVVVDLSEYAMPFYDADVEAVKGIPRLATELNQMIAQSDALIVASPEYNGSVSGVLKNALDWTSREGRIYKGKPVAIMSASPGSHGGATGLIHLRQILTHMGAIVIPKSLSIPKAYQAFDDHNHLTDPSLQEALSQEITALLHQ